jgi:hypothetical protein
VHAVEKDDEAVRMMRGTLERRVYAFGGEPSLAVLGDCRAALDAVELRTVEHYSVDVSRLPEMIVLGRAHPDEARVEFPAGVPFSGAEGIIAGDRGTLRSTDWFGKARSIHDRARNRVILVFPGMRYYNADFVTRLIVRPLLDRMLVRMGYLPLHASGVSAGTGCILLGAAGTGKSSLLSGLLRSGAGFLGDDRVLLRERGGLFRIDAFPEYIRRPSDDRSPKRAYVPPASGEVSADAGILVFLAPDGGKERIEHIGPAETAARLLASVPPLLEAECWEGNVDTAARIASSAETWVLRGWGNPERRVEIVRDLLSRRVER